MKHIFNLLIFFYKKSKGIFIFIKSSFAFFLLFFLIIIGFFTGILFYKIYNYFYNWNFYVPDSITKIMYYSKKPIAIKTYETFNKNFKKETTDIFNFLSSKDHDKNFSLNNVLCNNDATCVNELKKYIVNDQKTYKLPISEEDKNGNYFFEIFNKDHNFSLNNFFNFASDILNIQKIDNNVENWFTHILLQLPPLPFKLPLTFKGCINFVKDELNNAFKTTPLMIEDFQITDSNGKKIWGDDIFNSIANILSNYNFYTTSSYNDLSNNNYSEDLTFSLPLPNFFITLNQKIPKISNSIATLFLQKYFQFSARCFFHFSKTDYNINTIKYGVIIL